jgi:uncharacterized membrane protein YeaQ/YmgE (transglycosylase-associated protein family)
MDILLFIVLGGLAGWVASLIMGTDASQGIFLNVIVGVIGAFLGGMIFNLFGSSGVTGFNVWSFVVATLGAVLLLWIASFFRSPRTEY